MGLGSTPTALNGDKALSGFGGLVGKCRAVSTGDRERPAPRIRAGRGNQLAVVLARSTVLVDIL
jgi:hypothetical protein